MTTLFARPGKLGPPRVPVVQDFTPEQRAILEKTPLDTSGTPLNIFLTLAHHPRLLNRFNVLAGAFQKGVLSTVDRELVILRVSATCGSEYEFEQHTRVGLQCGLTEDDIGQLRRGAVSPRWNERQRALVAFTDDLLADDSVGDAVWNAVPFHEDAAAMLELICLIGFYRLGAGLTNVTRLTLEGRETTEEA